MREPVILNGSYTLKWYMNSIFSVRNMQLCLKVLVILNRINFEDFFVDRQICSRCVPFCRACVDAYDAQRPSKIKISSRMINIMGTNRTSIQHIVILQQQTGYVWPEQWNTSQGQHVQDFSSSSVLLLLFSITFIIMSLTSPSPSFNGCFSTSSPIVFKYYKTNNLLISLFSVILKLNSFRQFFI